MLNQAGLLKERRPPLHKVRNLVPVPHVHPARGQKERCQTGLRPLDLQLWSLQNTNISRDDDPAALLTQGSDPIFVLGIAGKLVQEMEYLMAILLRKDVKAFGVSRGETVVEEEFHAAIASVFSKSTASRTDRESTSYHRATASIDPSARKARARTEVGTDSGVMIGWPNERSGSITTR